MKFVFSLALAMLMSALAARSAELPNACPYRQTILALSDRLLADLDNGDPYIARRDGRDAAYLKLHYGQMRATDIDAMMKRLLQQSVEGNLGFVHAYHISTLGWEKATALLSPAEHAFFDTHPYDMTLAREMASVGRYDLVVRNLSEPAWKYDYERVGPMALPFIDFPVDTRRRMAEMADKAGIPLLAGGLFASLPDYRAWPGFLKRNVESVGFKHLRVYYIMMSGYNFDSPPLPDPHNSTSRNLYRQLFQRIAAGSWLQPQPALLLAFAGRYKFEPVYGKRAALQLRQAYERGELRPRDPMDKGWLTTLRILADVSGDPALIVEKMQTVFVASRRHEQGNAGEILDTMLAAEAIGPWLRGERGEFPPLPQLASGALRENWSAWQTMAETIRAGKTPDGLENNFIRRGMAAELLFAKGDEGGLLALIDMEANAGYRERLAADFMARYDRLCDSSLYFPGDGIFMGYSTIHRFPA